MLLHDLSNASILEAYATHRVADKTTALDEGPLSDREEAAWEAACAVVDAAARSSQMAWLDDISRVDPDEGEGIGNVIMSLVRLAAYEADMAGLDTNRVVSRLCCGLRLHRRRVVEVLELAESMDIGEFLDHHQEFRAMVPTT